MPQGWTIDATADTITFYEAPPVGTNNILVNELAAGGNGGTDVWAVGAWSGRYGYPSEVEFFNDRLWFAGTPADPQVIWASGIGDYQNFGRSSPIVDSDTVTFAINARQVNTIKDLIPLDNLLVMTTGGEYKVTGGVDEVVTPSTIGIKNQGNAGSGDIQSRMIGDSAIFVQEEGQKIRDLRYQFEKDGFRGNDISVWAEHLFAGFEIRWIEYWKAPWQVVWFVRDDGVLVGCTYMPEQEVIGWHWHETDGKYLDVCALPGKSETECYFLVERQIDGETVQCIEQHAPTRAASEDDLFFVDSGVTFDGRNVSDTTLTLTTGDGWTETDELTITASDPLFVGASDVGDNFLLWRDVVEVDGGITTTRRVSVRLVIDAFTDSTNVLARSIGEVPVELRTTALASWTIQRDTIDNLWHLEGKHVSVLQDSAVSGPFLVEDGKVTLDTPGGVVNLGLPYSCEVETLELNSPGGDSMRDMNKLAYKVSMLLLASRGVKAGGIKDRLYPVKERKFEDYGQPPFLKTGVFDVDIPAGWGVDAGRVRIVSDEPLPLEILSITTRAIASNGQAGGAKG